MKEIGKEGRIVHPIHSVMESSLRADLNQLCAQGHKREVLEKQFEQALASRSLDALGKLEEKWWALKSPPDFPYDEPDDYETIATGFPAPRTAIDLDPAILKDKLHGAWIGRCVGCQLGKPLENYMTPEEIEQVLKEVGSWPLKDYMNPPSQEMLAREGLIAKYFKGDRATWTKGRFNTVSPDDDIAYALAGIRLLELKGHDFTTKDVLNNFHQCMSPFQMWASGRKGFFNHEMQIPETHTALFNSEWRESLGAMIRCDPFGWTSPGNPTLAASMAYRDAFATQRRNGIYSGMFFAALMADVLAHGDISEAIETAAGYVPPRSRFAEMVDKVKNWCVECDDWRDVSANIWKTWSEESKILNHAITNAAIVLLGLLKGKGDFSETIRIAICSGLDTDCTGATAGSIMGCVLGTDGIPGHWTAPFHNTIESVVGGMYTVRINEIAERTLALAKKFSKVGTEQLVEV